MPSNVNLELPRAGDLSERRQYPRLGAVVPDPIHIYKACPYEFEIRHVGNDPPCFLPCCFVMWREERGAGKEQRLRDRLVDRPGQAPFNVEALNAGEPVGEGGARKVAEAIEIREGEAIGRIDKVYRFRITDTRSAHVERDAGKAYTWRQVCSRGRMSPPVGSLPSPFVGRHRFALSVWPQQHSRLSDVPLKPKGQSMVLGALHLR